MSVLLKDLNRNEDSGSSSREEAMNDAMDTDGRNSAADVNKSSLLPSSSSSSSDPRRLM